MIQTNIPCFIWLSFSDGVIPAPRFGFLLVIGAASCPEVLVVVGSLGFLTNLYELASFIMVGFSKRALCLTHGGGFYSLI